MSSTSNIVNAALWCIMVLMVVCEPVGAQPLVRSHYSVRFDTVDMALLRKHWSGPLQLTRDPASERQVFGRYGDQTVSLVLRGLPPHTMVNVAFELAVIGSWDGEQDKDRMRVMVDGRDTVLYATFSNTTYRQSYPDRVGVAIHRQRTGVQRQNTLGFRFVEKDVYNGSLDATYVISSFIRHSADTLRVDVQGILRDLRPGIENESWALLSFDVGYVTATTQGLHKVPGVDTSFSEDVFPGIVPSSDIVHALRIPLAVIECAPCAQGCAAASIAVYTDGTAAAWRKPFHGGEPAMAFDLTTEEIQLVDSAVQRCRRDTTLGKHLITVIGRSQDLRPDQRNCTISLGVGENAFTCILHEWETGSLSELRQLLSTLFARHGWTGGP
jgi:hypothetical protein